MSNISSNSKGMYKGKSHAEGGIPVVVDGNTNVEIEGNEYHLCRDAMSSAKIYSFKNKSNKEILDSIYSSEGCKFVQGIANSGDFIVCKLVVLDDDKRTITGTVKSIIDTMQSEKSCNVSDGSNKMEKGGGIENLNIEKFMQWYKNWYKDIADKMNILISLPSVIAPFKEDNVVILDLFEKIDQNIDAKPYLKDIVDKADEYDVTIYLEPMPRYKFFLKNIEKRIKISKHYLISYYEKFDFKLTPNKIFMKRLPKDKMEKGGGINKGGNIFKVKVYLGDYSYDREKDKETPMWFARVVKMNGNDVDGILTLDDNLDASDIGNFDSRKKLNDFIRVYEYLLNVIIFNEDELPTAIYKYKDNYNESDKMEKGGGINQCLSYIETNKKNILANGYYHYFRSLPILQDVYAHNTEPEYLNDLQFLLITYNSVNSLSLRNEIKKLLGCSNGLAKTIVSKYLKSAKKVDESTFETYKDEKIIIANRDEIVCQNVVEQMEKGGGIETLLAPNGKPSNLTPEQYKLVRTPAFKKWFGDWENDAENSSKVVDENGEPLVVYHGSSYGGINVFDISQSKRESSGLKEYGNYFTTNKKLADFYHKKGKLEKEEVQNIDREIYKLEQLLYTIKNNRDFDSVMDEIKKLKRIKDGNVYPVFLNLKKIHEFDAKGKEEMSGWRELKVWAGYKWANNRDAMDFLKEGKFEVGKVNGIKAKNIIDAFVQGDKFLSKELLSDVYLVFSANDIKLADGTNTTFDGNNDDIRYEKGGSIDEHKQTYERWKSLVNMSKSELKEFYDSQEGKDAGLSDKESNDLGISNGRESARWIMRMKDNPVSDWTPKMWEWANKQISFISRMSGNKGSLYDDKGNKTRKHTSLLIWGHNPKKMGNGGELAKGIKTEMEHKSTIDKFKRKGISDKEVAKSIAQDHLKEDSSYYSKLAKMEGKMEQGGNIPHSNMELLAPNGNKSNLNHEQWHLVRTPAFKQWFGDWENDAENSSKVVDENGEPLVVYRGMPKKRRVGNVFKYNVNLFGNTGVGGRATNYFAFYFTDKIEVAKSYGENLSQDDEDYIVKSYFLNIKNLFEAYEYKNQYEISLKTLYDKANKTNEEIYLRNANDNIEYSWDSKEQKNIPRKFYEYDSKIRNNYLHGDNYLNKTFSYFVDWNKKKDSNQYFWRKYLDTNLKYNGLAFYEITHNTKWDYKFELAKPIYGDEFSKTYGVFEPNDIKLADGTNTTFDGSNNDIRYEDGGEVSDISKVYSSSSRFKPSETIVFKPPLIGTNGAKLTAYTWAYEMTMKPNYEGELVGKRVSDWTQADSSAETGRDIVHKYTIELPNGDIKVVSSESVPILLGYIDRSQAKVFGNLATASKTLAKQQMKLAIMEAQKKEYDELYSKFEKAQKPTITLAEISDLPPITQYVYKREIEEGKGVSLTYFKMGDVVYNQNNNYNYNEGKYIASTNPNNTTIEQLNLMWITKRVKEAGGEYPRELYDLKNRVERQKRKVEQMLNPKMGDGGEIEYKEGGSIKEKPQLEEVAIYHEEKGNFIYPKNTIYAWLYDVPNAEQKLETGEFDFVLFPFGGSTFGMIGSTPPLLKVWTKSFQKTRKGSEHLIGAVKGFFEEKEGVLYIEMMTTRKDYRRKGVNSKIVKAMRDYFKLPQDKVSFIDTTTEGEKFKKSNTYASGGNIAPSYTLQTPSKEKSQLTYLQQILVRTKAFKDWFGDWEKAGKNFINDNKNNLLEHYKGISKAINMVTLEPLLTYHGTRFDEEFFVFNVFAKQHSRPYAYFAYNEAYSYNFSRGKTMYKCFLLAKNPFMAIGDEYELKREGAEYWINTITETLSWDKYKKIVSDDKKQKLKQVVESQIGDYIRKMYDQQHSFWLLMARDTNSLFKAFLMSHGFTSVFYTEEINTPFDPQNPSQYTRAITIFNANDIKLGDGRNLNFDPMKNDIRYDKGGEIDKEKEDLTTKNEYFYEQNKELSKKDKLGKLLFGDKYRGN